MNPKKSFVIFAPLVIISLIVIIFVGVFLVCVLVAGRSADSAATTSTTDATSSSSEKECLAKGGTWGTIGILSDKKTCNLPTTDANKECRDNSECQGECIAENSQSVLGKCNNRKINIGCRYFLANGKAMQICSDQ